VANSRRLKAGRGDTTAVNLSKAGAEGMAPLPATESGQLLALGLALGTQEP
jgi:hypothetical protein